jgi:hypothetical protein
MTSVRRCVCPIAGVMVAVTSAAVRRSNAQAATDQADHSTVIVLPAQAHPRDAMAATTAAVAHPVRLATDHLRIAAPAATVLAQIVHKASGQHRQTAHKGIVGRRV